MDPRLFPLNDVPPRDGEFVLYWMVASRRPAWNHALDHAGRLAEVLRVPLVVLEAIDADAPWASTRTHTFVAQGMEANAAAFAEAGILYWPYVEPEPHAGRGLVEALARRACAVVTDQYPGQHLPAIQRKVARLDVHVVAVDSLGLLPLAEGGAFPTAYAFRRHLHKTLAPHLVRLPSPRPPRWAPPPPDLAAERARWPSSGLPRFPRDVPAVATRGGHVAARAQLAAFLPRLDGYAESRDQPGTTSGLSPWLHYGHLSVFEVFATLVARAGWTVDRLGRPTGQREGWWNLPDEKFLDELVTWRELGQQFCFHRPDYAQYEGLPPWALATLDEQRGDPRPHVYDLAALDGARTHDEIWNAAQRELVRTGKIHNYLRMLWGKKVLEWSASPEAAWAALIELNNRYALDGRDPNSYSGIAWTFGRFDRPWGPRRPIFGTVRYMSSDQTRKKIELGAYLRTYGA